MIKLFLKNQTDKSSLMNGKNIILQNMSIFQKMISLKHRVNFSWLVQQMLLLHDSMYTHNFIYISNKGKGYHSA